MDFAKNLPTPNITTNDTYYKRQLSNYSFNIHVQSTSQSIFFMYPEFIAKKGADDVVSMLNYYIMNILPGEVKELSIYCDSCAGQNKNFTLFRYLHYIVHFKKRLAKATVTFPQRGHSYLECDKDFGLINQKALAEVPKDWVIEFKNARVRPAPFDVIQCTQDLFLSWSEFFSKIYKKTSPFATRPIVEYQVTDENCRTVNLRLNYNGGWESYIIVDQRAMRFTDTPDEPERAYSNLLPISKAKYTDLQCLKQFCSADAKTFYTGLSYSE